MAYVSRLSKSDMQYLQEVYDSILKHPERHVTIEDIATTVGINRTKLKAGFKKMFGTGIYELQLKFRMEKAETLLEDTNNDVGRIAMLLGYKSISSFNVAFKRKHEGLSPSHWRKLQKVQKG